MSVKLELENIEREGRIIELLRLQKVLSSYLGGEDIMYKGSKRNINNDDYGVLFFNGLVSLYTMSPKKIPINVTELPMECEVLTISGIIYDVLKFDIADNLIYFNGYWCTIRELADSDQKWRKKGTVDWRPFTKEVVE